MAAQIPFQGTMNRALTSVSVIDFPELNITSGFFGTKLARFTFEGATADQIPTLTGSVPSGRLFQMFTATIYLVQSQSLAAAWEQVRLTNSTIGDVIFVTASPTLPNYYVRNCILQNISDIDATGESVDFPLTIQGYYPINSALFG